MSRARGVLALAVAVSLIAQTTGAADLAAVAARPALAAQLPPRALLLPRPAPRPAPEAVPRSPREPREPRALPAPDRAAPAAPGPAQRALAFLDDVKVVAAWLLPPAASPAVAGRSPADVAREPDPPAATPASMPVRADPPPADRILIAKDPEIVGAAQALSRALGAPDTLVLAASAPQVEEQWFEGRGFRFRLVYLGAYGQTFGQENGFRVRFSEVDQRFVPALVPPALRRRAPVFFHGMTARFQVEVVALEDLKGLTISTRQEELDGAPLTPETALGTVTLAKGGRAVLEGSAVLLGRGQDAPVNFERTHLTARVAGEAAPRADQADAGLVDPPGPGL